MPGGSHWRDLGRRLPPHGDPLLSVRAPEDRGGMEKDSIVIYVGCAHEEPCPELARPCSAATWGRLVVTGVERRFPAGKKDGRIVAYWAKPARGAAERFLPHELEPVALVARRTAERVEAA